MAAAELQMGANSTETAEPESVSASQIRKSEVQRAVKSVRMIIRCLTSTSAQPHLG